MHALPFVLTLLLAAALAPALMRALREGGCTRSNYRERPLPFPFGVLALAAAVLALVPLMLLERLASADLFYPQALPVAAYALGRARARTARRHAHPRRRSRATHRRPRAAGGATAPRRCAASSRPGR